MIYHIEQTTSTNDDAQQQDYHHGDVIWAEYQTKGRGQRGHKWSSVEGKNLTFSLILEPTFLPVAEQFLLSEIVALALVESLAAYGIGCRIKWTNDIYFEDRKLVGILIEHHYSSGALARTIVGIGINVNQTVFDPELPNPVSMQQITRRVYDREEVLHTFLEKMAARYTQLKRGEKLAIEDDYQRLMYRLESLHTFRLPSGEEFEATIEGVRSTGELKLRHQDGSHHEYLFREVEFVL